MGAAVVAPPWALAPIVEAGGPNSRAAEQPSSSSGPAAGGFAAGADAGGSAGAASGGGEPLHPDRLWPPSAPPLEDFAGGGQAAGFDGAVLPPEPAALPASLPASLATDGLPPGPAAEARAGAAASVLAVRAASARAGVRLMGSAEAPPLPPDRQVAEGLRQQTPPNGWPSGSSGGPAGQGSLFL